VKLSSRWNELGPLSRKERVAFAYQVYLRILREGLDAIAAGADDPQAVAAETVRRAEQARDAWLKEPTAA
jgi:hypothetical protein